MIKHNATRWILCAISWAIYGSFIQFASSSPSICSSSVRVDSLASIVSLKECTTIEGDVTIQGANDLLTLDSLTALESIAGSLQIRSNPLLSSLVGLNSLVSIGGSFLVAENFQLQSLTGLDSLQSIGGELRIERNDGIIDVGGMNKIQTITGGITIMFESSLQSLANLLPPSFDTLDGDLTIHGNMYLENLNGLESLRTVRGTIELRQNPTLFDIAGLKNIETIVNGSLVIQDCSRLNELTALTNLRSITPPTGAPLIDLQPMPEIRCLPSFIHRHAPIASWLNPTGGFRTCEELRERFEEAGYSMSLATVLGELGLARHHNNFVRLHLELEHFLDLFQDPNHPFQESTPVTDQLWVHIIYEDEERERFQDWLKQENAKLRAKYGGRIPLRPIEVLTDPKLSFQSAVPVSMERYEYQDDLQRIEKDRLQRETEKVLQQQHMSQGETLSHEEL